jgi:hypothetical protein
MREETFIHIRRFRYATPPVIHNAAASAAKNELIN